MSEHEKMLLYLLKIISGRGRLAIKEHLMEQIGKPGEEDGLPGKLLNEINKLERGLGQLDRMDDEERQRLGLQPRPTP